MPRTADKPGDFPQFTGTDGNRQITSEQFIRANNGQVYRFDELSREAQLAIAHYMGIDGEAWDLELIVPGFYDGFPEVEGDEPEGRMASYQRRLDAMSTRLADHLEAIVAAKADSEYGYLTAPMQAVIDRWGEIDSDAVQDYNGDFDAYHEWYQGRGEGSDTRVHNRVPQPTWPAILSSFDDELLQDGWNRFHSYVENGAEQMALLWYPEDGVRQHD